MHKFTFWMLVNLGLTPFWAILFLVWFPLMETKYYPVMDEKATYVTRVEKADNGWLAMWGTMRKVRNCTWKRNEWFWGARYGRAVQLPSRELEKPKVRADGDHEWGRWEIKLPPNANINEIYANSVHQCKLFNLPLPWESTSRFWR